MLRRPHRRGVGPRPGSPRQGRGAHDREQAVDRPPLRPLSLEALRFEFKPAAPDPARTVWVDGTEPGVRSLSHWPGNSTPAALRHDLSTGIALAFARLSPAERRALIGTFDTIANNHYDTDGALSAFALLAPDQALPRAQTLLAAAATGDFSTWHGPAALAVDLTIMRLSHGPHSPLAGRLPADADDRTRWAASYAWCFEHLPAVLDDPFAHRALWAERFDEIAGDVARIEAGTGISVRTFEAEDLALVSSDRPTTSIGLHHAAGTANRVLYVRPSRAGFRYRFRYRDESWFVLARPAPPPRVPLGEVVARLNEAEGRAGPGAPRWWCGSIDAPVPELGFGAADRRDEPDFDDPDVEDDPPSRLLPSAVIDALRAVLPGRPAVRAC